MSRLRPARRSLWNRPPLPDGADPDAAEPPAGGTSPAARVLDEVSSAGRAIGGRIAPAAREVGARMEAGLTRVGEALSDPGQRMGAELLERADLPEIGGDSPLESLTLRLDREADLWRGVAFRHLERAAWAGRLVVMSGVAALLGTLALAAIGGFRALFGGALTAGPPAMLALAAGIVAAGALVAAWTLGQGRRAQVELGNAALMRSDLAEARLHRVAALLELRESQPEKYAAALSALESEMREAG